MNRIFGLLCSLFFVLFLLASCSKTIGKCQTNYNCPNGGYCIAGECKDTPPNQPAETAKEDGGEKEEPPKEEPPKKEPPKPVLECQKDDDCKDNKSCFDNFCVPGKVEIDFSAGHLVINFSRKSCSASVKCEPWRACSRGVCVPSTVARNQASKIKFKVEGQRVLFTTAIFGGGSYSEIIEEDGKKWLRTKIVGVQSAGLEQHAEIDIPFDKFAAKKYLIDGKDVKAVYYELHKEYAPPKKFIKAYAVGGYVDFKDAGKELGRRVSGTAKLIMKLVK